MIAVDKEEKGAGGREKKGEELWCKVSARKDAPQRD